MKQRNYPRMLVEFHSTFSSAHLTDGEGMAINLSQSGCSIMSLEQVPIGTELTMYLHPPHIKPPLAIDRAIVRWSQQDHFGVEFLQLQPDVAQELSILLNTIS